MTCKIKGGHEVKDRSIRSRKRKDAIADKLIDLSFTWLPPIMGWGAFIAGLFLAMGIANSSINTWIGVPLSVVALVAPGVLGCWIGLKLVGAINQKTHRDIPYSLTR